jgi:hypothetical protein
MGKNIYREVGKSACHLQQCPLGGEAPIGTDQQWAHTYYDSSPSKEDLFAMIKNLEKRLDILENQN